MILNSKWLLLSLSIWTAVIFFPLSLSAGRWNLTINLSDCNRWMEHPVADTDTKTDACPVSQHLTERQVNKTPSVSPRRKQY